MLFVYFWQVLYLLTSNASIAKSKYKFKAWMNLFNFKCKFLNLKCIWYQIFDYNYLFSIGKNNWAATLFFKIMLIFTVVSFTRKGAHDLNFDEDKTCFLSAFRILVILISYGLSFQTKYWLQTNTLDLFEWVPKF